MKTVVDPKRVHIRRHPQDKETINEAPKKYSEFTQRRLAHVPKPLDFIKMQVSETTYEGSLYHAFTTLLLKTMT